MNDVKVKDVKDVNVLDIVAECRKARVREQCARLQPKVVLHDAKVILSD